VRGLWLGVAVQCQVFGQGLACMQQQAGGGKG